MELDQIKQRFGIIGNNPELNRALEIARQVAGTDLSVLVTGESGVGKEAIPQVIHQNSPRKHGVYIAVNCGAIPEGTIDSELFGHEKGSFTGATEMRKGYFEEANGGTLFLDEVAELPLSTQVRLLRVLQSGEFLKVGSSKVQKTDVRVIAATNVNLMNAIAAGRFREDLFYRLNTVPIKMPALRERKEDIHLLFRKFVSDFADRYSMPVIRLDDNARALLESYRWPGNVRQLKSVAEQISILEQERLITADVLAKYIPSDNSGNLPVSLAGTQTGADYQTDRDIIFKILFQLRNEVNELKAKIEGTSHGNGSPQLLITTDEVHSFEREVEEKGFIEAMDSLPAQEPQTMTLKDSYEELLRKVLEKHSGHRRPAAEELGISERTLYRKIKEYGLE